MKKIISLVLALAMILIVGAAFAQDVDSGKNGSATITIANAAKGEQYSVVKLFDATVATDGTIAYQSATGIPSTLAHIFERDSAGNVTLKKIADTNGKNPGDDDYITTYYSITDEDFVAMKTWAEGQTATASAKSDGSPLKFKNLQYGYYVIISTQGAAVTVDSTKPNATVKDKNKKIIEAFKEVEKESYSVGDTVKYTGTFNTANYYGSGDAAKIVTKYEISDTLPEFLSDVKVTKVTIGGADYKVGNPEAYPQFVDKKIVIPWATKDATSGEWTSLYDNGAVIVVNYEAKLTDVTNINTVDTNTIKIQPYVGDNDEKPWEDKWQKDKTIKTYAAALKKVDGADHNKTLKDAQFTIKGLTVKDGEEKGEYIVVSYDPASTTESATLVTNDNGILYILGLAEDVDLTVTEVKAPDGYNKLTAPVSGLKPQKLTEKIYKQSGTIKYDAKGNVIESNTTPETTETITDKKLSSLDEKAFIIENNAGAELPETGGIGTTIFYILGGLLVVGAAVILVARRKAQD